MADLQVSLALLLENEAELARALEAAGGKVGRDFGAKLSGEAKKAFDDLVSQAEKAAKEVGVQFSRQDFRFRNAKGEFLSDDAIRQLAQANQGFAEATQALDKFRSALSATAREGDRSFSLLDNAIQGVAFSLTNQLTGAVTQALGSVRGLVGGFLELDGELRLAAAAAGEQGGYERLGKIVDKVGIDAAGTSKQVAELATSLIRAGFSVGEVEGALAGVVRGAEATGTGFESFGNIVGNTLRGFGLEVDQTARVVDILTNTANSSNASIEGLGYTFEYTAPIAKALGVSLEDVAAASGLMANAGIQGSVAGTGLRTALQKLQQAAGGASPEVMGLMRGQERLTSVMRRLGAELVDAKGKLLPLDQVFIRLKTSLEKLNQADQVQLANVLFGDEAGSKMLAITNQSSAAITKMFGDIKNSAGATDTARDAMVGMGLELQQLQGTMDSLGTTIGSVMAAGLRPLVGLANAAAGAISGLPTPVKVTGAALIGLGVAATAASVGMLALDLALSKLSVGGATGLAALRIAATGAAGAVAAMAGSIAAVAAIPILIGAVTGKIKDVDATTKGLLVTLGTVGTAAAVFRLAAFAVDALNARLAITGGLLGGIAAATKTKGIASLIAIAVAATGAKLAYDGLSNSITVSGEDATALSDKARDLKDQIKQLQDQIAEQKRLGLDTTTAEQRLAGLVVQLQAIEAPLDLKLDIRKAEGELKTLRDQLGKLGEGDAGRAPLEAQIQGLERYQALLKAMDTGKGINAFSKPLQEAAKAQQMVKDQIMVLTRQKVELPLSAKAQRDQIDQEISNLQQRLDKGQVLIRLRFEEEAAMESLAKVRNAIQAAPVTKRDGLVAQEERLLLQIAALRERGVTANRELLAIGRQELSTGQSRKLTAKEKLDIEKANLETRQLSASLADRAAGLEAGRLRIVQQVADAYANLASAQAALTQSGFDVERARNGQSLSLAERELQFLRERGAGAGVIRAAEERIAAIKRDGEGIEYRAMQASIQAAAQRFEIERRVLELKQAAQVLEQQGAIRAAEQGVLRERQRLVELRSKALDPQLTPAQQAAAGQQVQLQQQGLALAQQQVAAEQQRLQSLGVIFGLERQSQDAQQQTAANQQRAAAAAKGWEESLAGALGQLDRTATGSDRLAQQTQVLVGTIQAGDGPVERIYSTLQQLPQPLGAATDATATLSEGFATANAQARQLLATLQQMAKAPSARWAGGDVLPGVGYQVNELGTESFLSRSGALSLIKAPAYGTWSPPSPGMVLPAGLTAHLEAMGAFEGGGRAAPQLAAIAAAPSAGSGKQVAALGRLQRSIDRLEGTMRTYQPTVTVNLPGNAGLLHTLQSIR